MAGDERDPDVAGMAWKRHLVIMAIIIWVYVCVYFFRKQDYYVSTATQLAVIVRPVASALNAVFVSALLKLRCDLDGQQLKSQR